MDDQQQDETCVPSGSLSQSFFAAELAMTPWNCYEQIKL